MASATEELTFQLYLILIIFLNDICFYVMGTVNHYKMKFPLCWLLGSLPVWGPMLARAQNLMVCIFDIISFSASFYYPFFPHCPANFFFLNNVGEPPQITCEQGEV